MLADGRGSLPANIVHQPHRTPRGVRLLQRRPRCHRLPTHLGLARRCSRRWFHHLHRRDDRAPSADSSTQSSATPSTTTRWASTWVPQSAPDAASEPVARKTFTKPRTSVTRVVGIRTLVVPDSIRSGSTGSGTGTWCAQNSTAEPEPRPLSVTATWVTPTARSSTSHRTTFPPPKPPDEPPSVTDIRVLAISRERDGRYVVDVESTDPTGGRSGPEDSYLWTVCSSAPARSAPPNCWYAPRRRARCPNLNEHVGKGWGTNGDAGMVRSFGFSDGTAQAAPSASRIVDESGMPLSLENWYVPGLPVNIGMLGTLGMTLDSQRADFAYDGGSDRVVLNWPKNGQRRHRRGTTRRPEQDGLRRHHAAVRPAVRERTSIPRSPRIPSAVRFWARPPTATGESRATTACT